MKKRENRYLLAPWRWEFIRHGVKEPGCVFCRALRLEDEEGLILLRGKDFFLILNKFPYSSGHLMLAPNKHLQSPLEVVNGWEEFIQLQNLALKTLKKVLNPDGFNLGMNLGAVAGAGVADHFHLHIVPRWKGDANFMAVVGETRVVSFELKNIYHLLRQELQTKE